MREIILDIETTGLEFKDGHRVIEIGCIELNKKEVGANYHQYINPSKTLTEDNINTSLINSTLLIPSNISRNPISHAFIRYICIF